MHHVFGPYALYPDRAELIGPEGPVRLEPKTFAVLRLLVEHHDRIVSREEMIEVVWGGRFISDAAVSTALKFARKAVGDDGDRQVMIRTIHGLGHRFVAPVERRVDAFTVLQPEPAVDRAGQRPTLAVLPFAQMGDGMQVGDGLADEIIASLSRLRWLRVIARESSFRFRQDGVDLDAIRRVLGAGYALTGRVDLSGARLIVSVTLIDTGTGAVVWADRFTPPLDGLHEARQDIVDAVVGALDLQIPQAEAMAARGKPTEALDAWGAYHLGMSHLHRFNAHDNAIATALFERATTLDPSFAVAFAARAFARFQDGMQGFQRDREAILPEVRTLAERAVALDPYDPFVNMMMGRYFWMSRQPEDGLHWYERSTQLSPSFSKSHYSRGMIDVLAGRTAQGREAVDVAIHLSPVDPLLAPMLSAKAISYLGEGNFDAARDWALRSARSHPSHSVVVATTAAICHLQGDHAQASHWASELIALRPDSTASKVLLSLPFASQPQRAQYQDALAALGIPV